ncbi:hypothetical protein D9613_010436 [Agrocybe pediades]|uniref:Uncharacterized protein n=1 Tax=Agrocybe pediades TaxID=84607 RepID=A0A8H4QFQ3_9AGAR|nr:hypothetical protein D9613_010436 [Agrocybe pediades]
MPLWLYYTSPWPFVDIDDEVDPARIKDPDSHLPMSAEACVHAQTPGQEVCWCKYPQAFYPNWTPRQQKKSRIAKIIEKRKTDSSTIYYLDVMKDGMFISGGKRELRHKTLDEEWFYIQRTRSKRVQVRALFVSGLSGAALQMLGSKYNIEPFFFSSTIGWIPSRFQTHVVPHESDHITITLNFIRSIQNPTTAPPTPQSSVASTIYRVPRTAADLIIDTQAPLPLRSSNLLLLPDQLAVHMVRSPTANTIISLHPNTEHQTTRAEDLHTRVHLTGTSVYWSNIFRESPDPTFVFLSLLWYALYAWDEALEHLYNHLCFLEMEVLKTNDIEMTQELHVIRAHLLHFESLLQDFHKTVMFVKDTPNPQMQPVVDGVVDEEFEKVKERSASMMERECGNILLEIERLERSRQMQEKRLKNVMDLGFSSVNIEDSRRMKTLTEAAVKDSAAMKQIAYLTMAFMPASFVAAVFGMNVSEINPEGLMDLAHYVAVAIPLTIVTIWIIVAYQIQITESSIRDTDDSQAEPSSSHTFYGYGKRTADGGGNGVKVKELDMWDRLWWPVLLMSSIVDKIKRRRQRASKTRIQAVMHS